MHQSEINQFSNFSCELLKAFPDEIGYRRALVREVYEGSGEKGSLFEDFAIVEIDTDDSDGLLASVVSADDKPLERFSFAVDRKNKRLIGLDALNHREGDRTMPINDRTATLFAFEVYDLKDKETFDLSYLSSNDPQNQFFTTALEADDDNYCYPETLVLAEKVFNLATAHLMKQEAAQISRPQLPSTHKGPRLAMGN